MIKKFPFYKQLDRMDCGPTCLKIIAKHYGKLLELNDLREYTFQTREGVSLIDIADAGENMGFQCAPVNISFKRLREEAPLPCIAHWRQKHFIVVYKITKKHVYISDPAHGLIKYTKSEFLDGWIQISASGSEEGYLLLLEPTPKFYQHEEYNDTKEYGFKFLLWYFKPYQKHILQLFIGLIAGSLLQLIFPFLTQAVVDYGINYQNLNFIVLILIAQLTLFISQTSVNLIRGWILLHMTSRINISLISDFLIKLMKLPISFFDSKNTGDIIQRIYDHNRIQSFLSSTTLGTLFSIFNVLIFGSVLAYYSMNIFIIFFFGSLLYVGWTVLFMKKRKELDYKRFDQSASNQNSIFQLISGMQEIKLNGSERRRRWEWENIQVNLFKISVRGLALSQTQNTGSNFINEAKNIFITFIAAKSVITGDLTLGMMLAVQYIIGQLNAPINSFISFIQAGQDAKISLERLSEIHKKEEEDKSDNNESGLFQIGDIRLTNLNFRYGGQSSPLILKDINCVVPEGKVTAIVGTSGSGKTTLIKLLLKFYKIESGSIEIGGTNINKLNSKLWRKLCGIVMQDGFLFADTIARNITESDSNTSIDKKRLEHAVKVSVLEDYIEGLPAGYNTKIGSTGINISGGQRQRIFIARAVYKNPKYLFLDEATSALDANNERLILENLNEFCKGKTAVIVAHRLSTVKNADQILVLDEGRIIECGKHKSLVSKKGAYYTLVKNQLELGD